MFKYHIRQIKSRKWVVSRPPGSFLLKLKCQDAKYDSIQEAMQALRDELKNKGIENYDQAKSLQSKDKD